MPIKNDTKKEFKRIMDGMMYHCMDLTKFMEKHVNDPYFETEQGKRMMKYATVICASHAMACMEMMFDGMKDDSKCKSKPEDIEDILKSML